MDPKTKKGLLIGCGVAAVLLLACCVISAILIPYMGKQALMKGVPWMLKTVLAEELPEGVDKDRFNRLIDTGWAQFIEQGLGDKVDQDEMDQLLNVEMENALSDDDLSADEFDHLVDRFNEVLFNSEKDAAKLEDLKKSYRAGKEDGEWTPEELNEVLEKAELALNS